MFVVIDPFGLNRGGNRQQPPVGQRGTVGRALAAQPLAMRPCHCARGEIVALQGVSQVNKAVIAQPFIRAQVRITRLLVGLAGNRLDQFVGQLGADQLGPGPFHRRAELVQEMPHPVLAARQPVDQKRPHERPAHPCAKADRIVDF